MKVIRELFNFYINSSIHVALSVYSLAWITLITYGVPYDENVLYFIFYASITGYNFVKYFGVAKFHHRRLANWLKWIQIFSFFSFLFMCYYALRLQTITLLYIGGFGLITFLYAIPFLPKRFFLDSKQNLRSIGGLKVYLIALVWAGVTVLLPLINNGQGINMDIVLTAVQRFVFIVALMLPFEIRDLQYDSIKLATIPQKIGVQQTKLLGSMLLLVFVWLEFFKEQTGRTSMMAFLIIAFLTMLFLIFSRVNQSKFYSSFWVEGIPILWLILELLLS
ncbi:UbiA prenyltransferase family protein [Snuella sedimenti]|uniref:Prenyltransferase n=1 Tax=Snuella sedimenti TaxID=2798802 RepID=A0A8J7IGI1_9FLAO|nr:hypothetical protein [Snuella sedimenti]MBJ6366826.1 hypothetical protein [Snuella sedimenti]